MYDRKNLYREIYIMGHYVQFLIIQGTLLSIYWFTIHSLLFIYDVHGALVHTYQHIRPLRPFRTTMNHDFVEVGNLGQNFVGCGF